MGLCLGKFQYSIRPNCYFVLSCTMGLDAILCNLVVGSVVEQSLVLTDWQTKMKFFDETI